jgi:hypothetical protein
MSTYDVAVILIALVVAYALLRGAQELTHEIRRRLRRRAVRAELADLLRARASGHGAAGERPLVAEVSAVPTRDAGHPRRDPVIGVDQVIAERRARFLRHLDDRGLCIDDVRIESR